MGLGPEAQTRWVSERWPCLTMNTPNLQPTSVLVIRHDQTGLDQMASDLQNDGHHVTTTTDGHEAMKLIQQEPFDVVWLDAQLPGMDGWQTLEAIRQTHSITSLPVVMSVTPGDASDIVRAMQLGANDCVTQHPDVSVVLAHIQAQLIVKRTADRNKKLEVALQQRDRELEAAHSMIAAHHQHEQQHQVELEQLLDNALTWPVARVFREIGSYPPTLDEVCVIATDIVGFHKFCQTMSPKTVVEELNGYFKMFDRCCLAHDVEPLRSQGDSRIAIGGLHGGRRQAMGIPAIDAVLAMLAFRDMLARSDRPQPPGESQPAAPWLVRIGIHSGPAMIGVMSGTRLCLDVWGETVNIAARLEQGATPNQILVSDRVLSAARGLFDHGPIQTVHVKNTLVRGAIIVGICEPFRDEHGEPNEAFWKVYGNANQPDAEGTEEARRH